AGARRGRPHPAAADPAADVAELRRVLPAASPAAFGWSVVLGWLALSGALLVGCLFLGVRAPQAVYGLSTGAAGCLGLAVVRFRLWQHIGPVARQSDPGHRKEA